MNTFIKTPINYKDMNWATLSPILVLNSAKYHYKKTLKGIQQLEDKVISDQEYLKQIDFLSREVAQFCNLLFFLAKSGKSEYSKIDNKVHSMQLNIHYKLFSNKKIYKHFKSIKKHKLDKEDRYFIHVINKTFLYSGVNFSEYNKKKIRQNDQELSKAQMQYHVNCTEDTNNLKMKISKKDYEVFFSGYLDDIPVTTKNGFKIIELNEPNYINIMLNCESDKIRKEAAQICGNIATSGINNNNPVVKKILKLEKLAPKLLGYKEPNDFILNERVLNNNRKVEKFLLSLHKKLNPIVKKELSILSRKKGSKLEATDIDYYATKYKQEYFNIDFKQISQHFPFFNVFNKILELNKKLFGIEFKKCKIKTPHPEMLTYEIFDIHTNKKMGLIYVDVAYRKDKESGAWASELSYNHNTKEHTVILSTNFDLKGKSLDNLCLDFEEIQTLFHEMGHILHFVCPQIKYHAYLSEFVEWDFIELPSQLYEKWAENIDILLEISRPDKNGNKITRDILEKLLESNKLFKAMDYQFLIARSLLDLKVHSKNNIKNLQKFEYEILNKYQPVAPLKSVSRLMSFNHLFGGGYDVGLYSYIYANVLDANAWNLFLKNGIMNPKCSMKFRKDILDVGGSQPAIFQIKKFIGSISVEPLIASFKKDYISHGE